MRKERKFRIKREMSSIATIESKLKYYGLNMYYRFKNTLSVAYLNDRDI